MKRIVLFCAGGMSTGLLVNNMRKAAANLDEEYSIDAYGLSEVDNYGPEADVILVGPQVRYAVDNIKAKFPNKPIESIDVRTYGMMKGDVVLATARKLLGEE